MNHDGCIECKYECLPSYDKECQGCKQNSIDKYVRMTNADQIKSMNIKDLAAAIKCPNKIGAEIKCNTNDDCITCHTTWLQKNVVIDSSISTCCQEHRGRGDKI